MVHSVQGTLREARGASGLTWNLNLLVIGKVERDHSLGHGKGRQGCVSDRNFVKSFLDHLCSIASKDFNILIWSKHLLQSDLASSSLCQIDLSQRSLSFYLIIAFLHL